LFLVLAFFGGEAVCSPEKRAEILGYVAFLFVFALCTRRTIKNIKDMK